MRRTENIIYISFITQCCKIWDENNETCLQKKKTARSVFETIKNTINNSKQTIFYLKLAFMNLKSVNWTLFDLFLRSQ